MMPIESWEPADRQLAARIIRAKGSGDEALYLKLMQKHSRLRAELFGWDLDRAVAQTSVCDSYSQITD